MVWECSYFFVYLYIRILRNGVSGYRRTEIIPKEPDPVNTGGGICVSTVRIVPSCCNYQSSIYRFMNVIVNQQVVELPDSAKIQDLLSTLKIESAKGIALAINDQILRKEYWEEFTFSPNDKILIIKATQGG